MPGWRGHFSERDKMAARAPCHTTGSPISLSRTAASIPGFADCAGAAHDTACLPVAGTWFEPLLLQSGTGRICCLLYTAGCAAPSQRLLPSAGGLETCCAPAAGHCLVLTRGGRRTMLTSVCSLSAYSSRGASANGAPATVCAHQRCLASAGVRGTAWTSRGVPPAAAASRRA